MKDMNGNVGNATGAEVKRPKRKPKPVKPAAPEPQTPPKKVRKVDAAIVAIHKEAAEKVAAYRKEKAGERILRVIVTKRLAQLTEAQKQALFEELSKTCTPTLNLSTTKTP